MIIDNTVGYSQDSQIEADSRVPLVAKRLVSKSLSGKLLQLDETLDRILVYSLATITSIRVLTQTMYQEGTRTTTFRTTTSYVSNPIKRCT